MSGQLRNPVHFFNARGMSVMTEDMYVERIKELEQQLKTSQDNCRLLASRLRRIAGARVAK